ncbi:MAG: helix-turn-helix domain-containing protein [Gammaproteobacteria bacterium]|nr:helix-turn-helix domain-containing protein [Gammaproteobacteria bacterium]
MKALQRSALFIGVDDHFIAEILPALQHACLPRGYVMSIDTEVCRRFHLILRGRIKIGRHHLETGREVTLLLLGPSDGFHVLNLLDGTGTHDLQTQAIDDVELLWAPVERWLAWMDENNALRRAMANVAASRIEHFCELAGELALESTMTRLVHLLLRHFDGDTKGLNLIEHLPQEELANMIGTVRPVVARLLGELRRDGAVEMCNGDLRITDLQRLLDKADRHLIEQNRFDI